MPLIKNPSRHLPQAGLALLALLLAWTVTTLGAYVRIEDAGLGCPDWPGCYGEIQAPRSEAEIQMALARFPGASVDPGRAIKEMLHRYAAGTLGLLILLIALLSWRRRDQTRYWAGFLLVLVTLQALLGMLTVTKALQPVIVTAHLLGGMSTLAVLAWLTLRHWRPARPRSSSAKLPILVGLGIVLTGMQIALGGWTSSHEAGLICGGFPQCQESWMPPMDFAAAFAPNTWFLPGLSEGWRSMPALTAIHWTHRVGALVLLLYLGALSIALWRQERLRKYGLLLIGLLLSQITLGIANVLLGLPVLLATAHNAVAALLLLSLVLVFQQVYQKPEGGRT